ncbi:styrene monooxygenase/indole monooxygenase family protein [Rhizobium sp. RU36D]|uniref:styrene monooxygenase/indole monooxygenase family protein n=1 Tax=Rhizobium sp. RU36D TaxID=1907415 RepID=UPI0009D8F88E|nr:styrene monooxygenase/indole monooxygenase family protein [Rhizobium sp. RU36D]SMC47358.1 2-polyprenyl-6-methoxyphenol hydroxylase [Rhizobium sp. RU36D]
MSKTRHFTIVGGGQSGLQLGCGLLDAGHTVHIVQNRTGEEIRAGKVLSSQCMFDQALQNERDLGLNFWEDQCPTVDSINFCVPAPDGSGKAIDWNGKLDKPGMSVDQRLKIPHWMTAFEKRGGRITIAEAGIAELEDYTRESDLVIVAAGKGEINKLFERDPEKSPYDKPQRSLALTYVTGMTPRPDHSAVNFNLIPGIGEYFVFPALTTTGPCDIMVFEGIPGGPMDCWKDVRGPEQHLEKSKWILDTFLPWEAERCRNVALTDDNGILAGAFAPTVRKPVGRLPSGAIVLGMADAVCLNDPITGQGSNNASKAAKFYLDAILAQEDRPFDAAFMQATFDSYWAYAQFVVGWTNALLAPPPPHVLQIMGSAQAFPQLAKRIANGFNDPRDFFPWFAVPEEAEAYLTKLAA